MRERSATLSAAGWRIVLLASLGGTLEFYDFVVFGIFAKDIADAFFPSTSAIVSLMASFGAFATGYLARPIGGIVLSHYGDRYGRRRVFLWSVFVMSGATLGMGLVPPHARWGAVASATIVLLRLIQGFCLGGELPGALTYVVETTPRLAPLVCGVVFACVTMGVAVATGVSLMVRSLLLPANVPMYGWRIAFVLGGLGGVLSFILRQSLEESPEFARMRALAVRQPFRELLRTHAVQVVVGCALLAATACPHISPPFFDTIRATPFRRKRSASWRTPPEFSSSVGLAIEWRRAICCAQALFCCSRSPTRSTAASKHARSARR